MKTWIPRILQDDGMLPMCEAPSYAKCVTQYVRLADCEQALAEKDREIQQIREHEFQNGYREAEAIWEEKYSQLMAQAVRFAECLSDQCKCRGYEQADCTMHQALAFLKEHNHEQHH